MGIILLYPREVVLTPKVEVTVYYENGQIGKHIEVVRNWNSYMSDAWKANVAFTDENGRVTFKKAIRRIPIIYQSVLIVIAPFLHYSASNVASLKARDLKNHKIWERIDYKESNCCPNKIIMKTKDSELDYMVFGD